MGSIGELDYSVPREAQRLLDKELLGNRLIPTLPKDIHEAAKHITFTGNDAPSIPINWRFAESVSALKAFEASMLNVLRSKKYGVGFDDVTIDTDHASLFVMSPFIAQVINEKGEAQDLITTAEQMAEYGFKNTDLHGQGANLQRTMATSIYRTKDGRYYHCHGSMNPGPTLKALGLSLEAKEGDTWESVASRIQTTVAQHDSAALDTLMNEDHKQAGTIAYTCNEFLQSAHGRANAHVGLYELHRLEDCTSHSATWWPDNPSMPSSPQRPLAGLKVVDLTRIIAAPTITRSLAEMGASVMRVTSAGVTDMSGLHLDLQWGKWNCDLNLKGSEADREKLRELIRGADVVVEGYRPGAMARNGFGREEVLGLVEGRGRGVVHVRENCYGWNGPWQHRSGWQQISDACCGVSLAYGRAMGHDEAVTPVFPNSDYCTGISGCTAVLHALIRRGEDGGSYGIDASLNYYSQWLTASVGTYPPATWAAVWARHGKPVYRHWHNMPYTLPRVIGSLRERDAEVLFRPEFFERRESKAVGRTFVQPKPVAGWKGRSVRLGFNVGSRGNGVDEARWPKDLGVEVVR